MLKFLTKIHLQGVNGTGEVLVVSYIYVTVFAKIDHTAQKFEIEIITSLYSAKPAEYADIFVFFMTNEQKVTSR